MVSKGSRLRSGARKNVVGSQHDDFSHRKGSSLGPLVPFPGSNIDLPSPQPTINVVAEPHDATECFSPRRLALRSLVNHIAGIRGVQDTDNDRMFDISGDPSTNDVPAKQLSQFDTSADLRNSPNMNRADRADPAQPDGSEDFNCNSNLSNGQVVSSVETFGEPDEAVGQYWRFRNVCYRDSKLLFFTPNASYDPHIPEYLQIGVGFRQRGRSEMLRVSSIVAGSDSQLKWFQEFKPCWTKKLSLLFARPWVNYYFTLYTAFGVSQTLREQIQDYPHISTRNQVLLFVNGPLKLHDAPPGLFDVFTDASVNKLSYLDKHSDIGLCFPDLIVGLSKKALLGEDVWFDPEYCPETHFQAELNDPENEDTLEKDSVSSKAETDSAQDPLSAVNWRNYALISSDFGSDDRISQPYCFDECCKAQRARYTKTSIRHFCQVMIHRHGIAEIAPPRIDAENIRNRNFTGVLVTIMSRKGRRVIANEDALVAQLEALLPGAVIQAVQFELLSFHEQMTVCRASHVLIGMHGAGFSNALWLTERSSAIEIFPYRYYKPTFQTLASLAGIHIEAWQNGDVNNTIAQWYRLGPVGLQLSAAGRTKVLITTRLAGVIDARLRNFFKNQDSLVPADAIRDLIVDSVRKYATR